MKNFVTRKFLPDDIDLLARQQLHDYKNRRPGNCFADPDFEMDIQSAYKLQDAVAKLRQEEGDTVAGYKIGCIGGDIKTQFGIEGPVRGTLFLSELFRDGEGLNSESFANLAVEAEMAFSLLDGGQIDRIFPVIELHNLVFRGLKKSLPELIANNCINAGVVVPTNEVENVTEASEITLQINEQRYSTNEIWPINNTPNGSLGWLQKNLKSYALSAKSGHMVLAGTSLGLYPVKAGDTVTVFLNEKAMVKCNVH